MKTHFPFSWTAIAVLIVLPVCGQGTFHNLDFESASLPVIPSGQFGTFQPISNALPFWNAYVGTNQISQILHNNLFIGTANVSILGPDWTRFIPRIDGAYTVVLEPGTTGQALVDVSLGQTGLIPAGTQSIQFKSDPFSNDFAISIGGTTIPVFLLGTNLDYSLHGADVSAFAGLTRELRITALYKAGGSTMASLDSIQFSDQPIPEPSMFGLFALGALLLGWQSRKKRKP